MNTLEKLRADLQNQINNIDVSNIDTAQIYSTIRGGIDESMDTLEKLRAAMVARNVDWAKLVNVPEFKGSAVLSNNTIDWRGVPELRVALSANTVFDASNLIAGKTIGLEISGGFSATFAPKFVKVDGSPDPDPAEVNYVTMRCIRADAGNERIIYSVNFLNV